MTLQFHFREKQEDGTYSAPAYESVPFETFAANAIADKRLKGALEWAFLSDEQQLTSIEIAP